MGTGIDAARELGGGAAADAIDNMKDQLLIALLIRVAKLERTKDEVIVPVADIDGTGDHIVTLRVNGDNFVFGLGKKN